jgi:hypothetical protein
MDMQIQEYNLHIQHISGAESFLEDTVSGNPAGLCELDTKELFKPKDMVVAAINLSNDNSVERVIGVPSLRKMNPRNNPNCEAKTRKC